MKSISERPAPRTKPHVDSLVGDLPFNERIPRRSGDVAFDHSWEIRAFSMAVALHDKGVFPWEDFQHGLIEAIREWEAAHTDTADWSYYERWMAALEALARSQGWLTEAELDERASQILALPPNAHHQHAVREPVSVSAPADRGGAR